MRIVRSDNNSGLVPEAITALQSLEGHAEGYGDDPWTQRATDAFRELFASEVEVFFVATGTAANTLAIASLTEPWQRVVCHRHAHWNDDESTAPERITLCRTTVFSSHPSKLIPADLQFIAENGRGDVHQPAPGVVTISNPTEFGTVYRPEEIRALTDLAQCWLFGALRCAPASPTPWPVLAWRPTPWRVRRVLTSCRLVAPRMDWLSGKPWCSFPRAMVRRHAGGFAIPISAEIDGALAQQTSGCDRHV